MDYERKDYYSNLPSRLASLPPLTVTTTSLSTARSFAPLSPPPA